MTLKLYIDFVQLFRIIDIFFIFFFFFNDTATTEIYTLSLHDALPIWPDHDALVRDDRGARAARYHAPSQRAGDRKSTGLNSSHMSISYAVFCLKKKKKERKEMKAEEKKKRKGNKNRTERV